MRIVLFIFFYLFSFQVRALGPVNIEPGERFFYKYERLETNRDRSNLHNDTTYNSLHITEKYDIEIIFISKEESGEKLFKSIRSNKYFLVDDSLQGKIKEFDSRYSNNINYSTGSNYVDPWEYGCFIRIDKKGLIKGIYWEDEGIEKNLWGTGDSEGVGKLKQSYKSNEILPILEILFLPLKMKKSFPGEIYLNNTFIRSRAEVIAGNVREYNNIQYRDLILIHDKPKTDNNQRKTIHISGNGNGNVIMQSASLMPEELTIHYKENVGYIYEKSNSQFEDNKNYSIHIKKSENVDRAESVIISGKILNPNSKYIIIGYQQFPYLLNEGKTVDLDDSGTFHTQFEIFELTEIAVQYGVDYKVPQDLQFNRQIYLLLSPGDSVFIKFDASIPCQFEITGDGSGGQYLLNKLRNDNCRNFLKLLAGIELHDESLTESPLIKRQSFLKTQDIFNNQVGLDCGHCLLKNSIGFLLFSSLGIPERIRLKNQDLEWTLTSIKQYRDSIPGEINDYLYQQVIYRDAIDRMDLKDINGTKKMLDAARPYYSYDTLAGKENCNNPEYFRFLKENLYFQLETVKDKGKKNSIEGNWISEAYYFSPVIYNMNQLFVVRADLLRSVVEPWADEDRFLVFEPLFLDFFKNCHDSSIVKPVQKIYNREKYLLSEGIRDDLKLIGESGNLFDPDLYRGKVTLAGFWSPYNKEEELDSLNLIMEELINTDSISGTEFFTVFLDRDQVRAEKWISEYTFPGKNYYLDEDRDSVLFQYDLSLTSPQILIFDKYGKLAGKFDAQMLRSENLKLLASCLSSLNKQDYEADLLTEDQLKKLLIAISAFLFVSIIISVIISIRSRYKARQAELKRKVSELELDAIRGRMNPHFIYNALSSIQSLINSRQIRDANTYLVRFSEISRYILNESGNRFVPLSSEVEFTRNYLELEHLRSGFQYTIKIHGDTELMNFEIPAMLVQPVIENAVKHGMAGKGKAGQIEIIIEQGKNNIKLNIKDNGKGIKGHAYDLNFGHGLNLVREKIRLFKDNYNYNAGFSYGNVLDNRGYIEGFEVQFKFPADY